MCGGVIQVFKMFWERDRVEFSWGLIIVFVGHLLKWKKGEIKRINFLNCKEGGGAASP